MISDDFSLSCGMLLCSIAVYLIDIFPIDVHAWQKYSFARRYVYVVGLHIARFGFFIKVLRLRNFGFNILLILFRYNWQDGRWICSRCCRWCFCSCCCRCCYQSLRCGRFSCWKNWTNQMNVCDSISILNTFEFSSFSKSYTRSNTMCIHIYIAKKNYPEKWLQLLKIPIDLIRPLVYTLILWRCIWWIRWVRCISGVVH